ncbi:unnamed protein product [Blepharisma stoltei]|uniref:Uncharacterized protein n=1 Tax=Blepharisma stoltei TaxID=1481888 RepID=A0AAU9K025_9CILI|nr:unnamed protein product [Blepharisma stoltei]
MTNKGISQDFINDVTQRIYKIQEYSKTTGDDVTHLLLQNLTHLELSHQKEENEHSRSLAELPAGIPLPQDLEKNKFPVDESLVSDISDLSDRSQSHIDTAISIKKQTKQMYKAINEKLTAFRAASQNLAGFTNVDSDKISVLFSELDNMKRTIFEFIEDSSTIKKAQSASLYPEFDESSIPTIHRENHSIIQVMSKINELQKEMHKISAQMVCSEKELQFKEEENLMLKTQLKSLENVAQTYIKLEEAKPNLKKTNCVCALF